MQTKIHPDLQSEAGVAEAESILRSCVHCGFCTAVCPTYQLLGDELDGPRGRIYLIKNVLESDDITTLQANHLDRCLTCRSCETACPSGVEYGRLLDIGRGLIATRYGTQWGLMQRARKWGLQFLLPKTVLFSAMIRLGQLVRPLLPGALRRRIPVKDTQRFQPASALAAPALLAGKRVLLLDGCAQKATTPGVNRATEYLLSAMGVQVEKLPVEGCCGALDYHLGDHEVARSRIRTQVDRLHDRLAHVDFVVSTASGCGVTIKEYPHIFIDEPIYRRKAQELVARVRDLSELFLEAEIECLPQRVAVHEPCTLQHGQRLPGIISEILSRAGAELVPVQDTHLCCGSAGTYSVMQPDIADQLTANKIAALTARSPEVIVTANVGCQLQLQGATDVPVMHWIEFVARYLKQPETDARGVR